MSSTPFSRIAYAGFVALTIGTSAPVMAQTAAQMQSLRDNCKLDYLRLCAGLSPEGPEIRACFKRNRAQLSEGCSSAIAAAYPRR